MEVTREELSAEELFDHYPGLLFQSSGIYNERLPVLESVFRLFLANGKQPLDLEELGKQLGEWRGGDSYCTSVELYLASTTMTSTMAFAKPLGHKSRME